jgi:hypothetical protein
VTAEDALAALDDALRAARVWSGVDANPADPTSVRIESAQCEDPALAAAVDAQAEALAAAGFARVQCYSRHGARVFEREL